MSTSYWDYIKTEELLSLQHGADASEASLTNEEVLFIVVHQVDELWFKLALRELTAVRNLFAAPHVPEQSLSAAARGLRRTSLLFGKLASHFEVMETMTTRDYLAFRGKLMAASGFQSSQLREVEVLLGLEAESRIPYGGKHGWRDALRGPGGRPTPASARLEARLADKPHVRDAVEAWLYRTPIQGSTPDQPGDGAAVRAFIEAFVAAHASEVDAVRSRATEAIADREERARAEARFDKEREAARSFLEAREVDEAQRARRSRIRTALVFIESYRELPLLAWPREILDGLVELEQAFVLFRHRHARMVERMIGRRTGTGGSSGVDYLDETARYRVFHDLWAARTVLVRREALPPVKEPERYGFAAGR